MSLRAAALVAAALVALLAAPTDAADADADRYSTLAGQVDAAEAKPSTGLGPAQHSEVRRLRDEGRALHARGEHRQAAERLAEAATILGLR
jgi:hypothetical protein